MIGCSTSVYSDSNKAVGALSPPLFFAGLTAMLVELELAEG